ncbi:sulfotransferase 6B1-like [Zootoca vivipara]|uniref:sulfotransferase 6B1-like n=1 Tax=Zootoca vivipara TaxID=8524 RepID=UPI0015910125|nr:sulfotransferase 6B1-like [Zootoca vivipara]
MTMNRKRIEILDKMSADADKLAPEDKLFTYKGILYPLAICKLENFQALETFDARTDDVILAGYPKTGTNWLETMLRDLEFRAGKYTEEEYKRRMAIEEELAVPPRLEFGDLDAIKRMTKLPSRRIIVTHLPPLLLPKSIFKNKAKILALTRNPKDTMVSYFHFSNNFSAFPNATWDAYFRDFMNGKVCWGSYFDHVSEWDKYIDDENVMGICYEELKEDIHSGLQKIAKFCGFSVTEEEIKSVVEECSFKAMKQKSIETHGAFGDALFRKGSVGDWKSLFSESQNQEMDRRFEECLAKSKLGAKMKYEVNCKI